MKSFISRSLTTLVVLAIAVAGSLSLAPNAAFATAVTVSALTATSSNASVTYAKLGDTVNYQLTLGGGDPLILPQINIFNLGSTTMTKTSAGGAFTYTYATTTNSINTWADGLVTFKISVGQDTAVGTATTTVVAVTSGSNVTYDTTAPTTPAGINSTVFHGTASFVLTSTDANVATIYYTTDGTTPTCSHGTVYSSAVSISGSTSIQAVGCDPAGNISSIASAVYSPAAGGGYTAPTPVAPAATPAPAVTTPAVPAPPAAPATMTTPAAPATPAVPATPATSAVPSAHDMLVAQVNTLVTAVKSQDLMVGKKSESVRSLQTFLIAQAKGTAAATLAKNGTTQNFGMLTKAALVEFQKSVGITPASGYFGPKTRAYIASLGQ